MRNFISHKGIAIIQHATYTRKKNNTQVENKNTRNKKYTKNEKLKT